jgi:hypothetical protein
LEANRLPLPSCLFSWILFDWRVRHLILERGHLKKNEIVFEIKCFQHAGKAKSAFTWYADFELATLAKVPGNSADFARRQGHLQVHEQVQVCFFFEKTSADDRICVDHTFDKAFFGLFLVNLQFRQLAAVVFVCERVQDVAVERYPTLIQVDVRVQFRPDQNALWRTQYRMARICFDKIDKNVVCVDLRRSSLRVRVLGVIRGFVAIDKTVLSAKVESIGLRFIHIAEQFDFANERLMPDGYVELGAVLNAPLEMSDFLQFDYDAVHAAYVARRGRQASFDQTGVEIRHANATPVALHGLFNRLVEHLH